jgi:hypothetical protein
MRIRSPLALAITVAALHAAGPAHAARFFWEGRLDDAGRPASGRYDLRLTAFGGEAHGASLAPPVTLEGIEVRDGRFQAEVDLPLVASDRVWFEVAVRGSGEAKFASIPGRSPAIAKTLIGQCWRTTGDAGSDPAINFIGTTDARPFVIRTAGSRNLMVWSSEETFEGLPITANVLGGSRANLILSGVRGATIAGGGVPSGDSDPEFAAERPNLVSDHYGFVGGGYANVAGNGNSLLADAAFATVGGGAGNRAAGPGSSVHGGLDNRAEGPGSHVGGGTGNAASGEGGTIAGGALNVASGPGSAVAGGAQGTASGWLSVVAGGWANCAGGEGSWAGGTRAKVRPGSASGAAGQGCAGVPVVGVDGDRGTFVWADSQDDDFLSSGENQFLIRAAGGVGIGTGQPSAQLHVVGPGTKPGLRVQVGGTTRLLADTNGGVSIGSNIAPPPEGLRVNGVIRVQTLGAAGSQALCRNGSAEIASCSSSARYKDAIADLDLGLDAVLALRPVGYRWKDGGAADLGFVAEEVAALDERLVTRNAAGEVEGVRYERLAAVLANAVQDLVVRHQAERETVQAQLDALRAEIAAMRAQRASWPATTSAD